MRWIVERLPHHLQLNWSLAIILSTALVAVACVFFAIGYVITDLF